jgi:hypothetical protein
VFQAQADGENDVAGMWGKLVRSYTVVLTMVAVALFLFGTGLALIGRNRVIFATLGILLVLSGVSWAGVTSITAPQVPSDAAAQNYASGVQAMASATSPKAYDAAIDAFTKAISARPDFVKAYHQRANAEALRGGEVVGSSYVGPVQPKYLELAIGDDQKAFDLGLRDEGVVADLSFELYSRWLQNGSGSPPAAVIQLGTEATRLDPTPVPWFNLGLYQLASGNVTEATTAYQKALNQLLAPDSGTPNGPVTGAMSDLVNLASSPAPASHQGLLAAITNEEGILAASLASGQLAAPSADPSLASAHVDASTVNPSLDPNALLVYFAGPPALDPNNGGRRLDHESTFVIWYARPTPNPGMQPAGWTGIANVTSWSAAGAANTELSYDSGTDRYTVTSPLLSTTGACLSSQAQYRVDIYVAGHLVFSSIPLPGPSAELVPQHEPDLEIGVCTPRAWVHLPTQSAELPDGKSVPLAGIVDAYGTSDAAPHEGVVMVRVYPPRAALKTGNPIDVVNQELTSIVTSLTNSRGLGALLPQDLALTHDDNFSNTVHPGYFAGLNNAAQLTFQSSSTAEEVWAGAGTTQDNAVVAGVVFGSHEGFSDPTLQLPQVFLSFGLECGAAPLLCG